MGRTGFVACCVLALSCLAGCGEKPPPGTPTAAVKGSIKLDGKPVANGEIHFGMAGVPPSVLQITNGTFAGEAPIGKNQVEVFIYVEGPKSEKYGGTATKTNIVPERYWGSQTTLAADVTADGANEFTFEISSK